MAANIKKYFGWACVNGLILGILITEGQDISEIGLLSSILDSINEALNIPNYFWLKIFIFIVGIASTLSEVYLIWQQKLLIKIMVAFAFLSFLFLVLATAWNSSFLEWIGIISLLIAWILGYRLSNS